MNGYQVEKFGCSPSMNLNLAYLEILLPMVEKYLNNPEDIQNMTMAMTMNHAGKLLVCKVFLLHLNRHLHLYLHLHLHAHIFLLQDVCMHKNVSSQ